MYPFSILKQRMILVQFPFGELNPKPCISISDTKIVLSHKQLLDIQQGKYLSKLSYVTVRCNVQFIDFQTVLSTG
ncbi:hypothetical protein BBM17_00565 [Vibrio parahaemolyticus]|nr:hypothetical protein BBM17_00565 [Vibrio parahaemolyticus]